MANGKVVMVVKSEVEATPQLVKQHLTAYFEKCSENPFPFESGDWIEAKPEVVQALNALEGMPFLVVMSGESVLGLCAYMTAEGPTQVLLNKSQLVLPEEEQ